MNSIEIFNVKNHRIERCGILVFAVFIILISGYGSYSDKSFFKAIDLFFYDHYIKTFSSGRISNKLVIIDIDEVSLSAVGQWPWPRYQLAQLIKKISDLNPKTISLDINLPEPDRNSLKNIQKQFKKDFDIDLNFTGVPKSLSDNDVYLAHIIQTSNLIGGRYFYFDHINKTSDCNWAPLTTTNRTKTLSLHKATGILCNTFRIEKAFKTTGFTNNQYDFDGLMRRIPLLIEYQDEIYAHFSLATLLKVHGITEVEIKQNIYGHYIQADNFKIPITKKGFSYLRYSGPSRKHRYISAVNILNDRFDSADIDNKIVLIGSSAVGLFDVHQTMFDPYFPGVETHAVFINSVYQNNQIIKPIWNRHLVFSLCLITGILMICFIVYSNKPSVLATGSCLWIFLLFGISLSAFKVKSLFVSPCLPVLLGVILFSLISFFRFISARNASFIWFKKLATSQQITMETLVNLVETRDPETGYHIKRTQHYARVIMIHLKENGFYKDILIDDYMEMLFLSVPLHDIGKVGIPDRILLKPGKLTEEEFELMKLHASYGRYAIEKSSNKFKEYDYLNMGAEIAGSHHERWDGKGYPEGLLKEEIPLSARIMSICDVYDALISRRCYKEPFSHKRAMTIILKDRGTAFDPVIVDAFFAVEEKIKHIALEFKDQIEKASEKLKDVFMQKIN